MRKKQSLPGFWEWAEHVRGDRVLEILAVRIGQWHQGHRPQAGGVVDQHIHAAERACQLDRRRMDVLFPGDVTGDPVSLGPSPRDFVDAFAPAGHEGDVCAARQRFLDQRQSES